MADDAKTRFGRFAKGYRTSETHAHGDEMPRLLEITSPEPTWRVLDVATGAGHTALLFAPYVAHVTAVDITPEMLDQTEALARARGVSNVLTRLGSAEELPAGSGEFDLVTCRIAAHHFQSCPTFVGEAARVLIPGGLLLVQDQVLPEEADVGGEIDEFERTRDPSHKHAYSQKGWSLLLESAGLTVVHAEVVIKRHGFQSWAERQGCSREVIHRLETQIINGSPGMRTWMEPRDWHRKGASFVNRHLIIAGRKTEQET